MNKIHIVRLSVEKSLIREQILLIMQMKPLSSNNVFFFIVLDVYIKISEKKKKNKVQGYCLKWLPLQITILHLI